MPPTRGVAAPVAPSAWVDAIFAVVDADWRACLQVAWAVSTSLRMLVMPLLAASSVLTERPMLSSSRERSLARAEKPAATKKLSGLSSAEFTFLPVARRFWVAPIRSDVFCNARRLFRMPELKTMSDMRPSP